jgi:hypothetical protein
MTDFFQEVDEEVRREKAELFWRKHQNLVLGAAVAVIVATAGYQVWRFNQQRDAQNAAAAYESAITLERGGKAEDAERLLVDLAGKAPAGYKALARMRAAAIAGQRDPAVGVKLFDALAEDQALDPTFRDVARLRAGYLLSSTASLDELAKRLDPLAVSGQALRFSARELLGVKALEVGDYERAAAYLDQIVVESDAPAGLRQRAELMLGLVRAGKPSQG